MIILIMTMLSMMMMMMMVIMMMMIMTAMSYFSYLYRSKQLIKDAILDNDFLKNLDSTQIWEMVNCMYEKRIQKDHYIIKESEAGQALYVSAGK